MGLKYTLSKENNRLYHDFIDAYWSVDDIAYTTQTVSFRLNCYPSREAKYKNLKQIGSSSLSFGGAFPDVFSTILYTWENYTMITDIFPDGIPLSEDEQKTAIYEWVKAYTGLGFENVLES